MRVHPNELHDPVRGCVIGIVVDNDDPEKLNRVQVKFPVADGDILSAWARVVTLMTGNRSGFMCVPQVDSEVIVRFVHGNPMRPMVVGCVNNGKEPPPYDNADGKNDMKLFYSRGFHFELDEKSGAERVSLYTADGKTGLEMLTADKKLVGSSAGNFELICPSGSLKVDAGGSISLEAKSKYSSQAGQEQLWDCDAKVEMKGSAGVGMTAPKIDYKA